MKDASPCRTRQSLSTPIRIVILPSTHHERSVTRLSYVLLGIRSERIMRAGKALLQRLSASHYLRDFPLLHDDIRLIQHRHGKP